MKSRHFNRANISVRQTIKIFHFRFLKILLSVQKAIAHILGTLDDKIELNQKMNQTLEEIAKAIFKSWFVDFDPVRAKAEGRPTGLPPEISDLFPDELVDSEIGEIPKGWEFNLFRIFAKHGLSVERNHCKESIKWFSEPSDVPPGVLVGYGTIAELYLMLDKRVFNS